MKGSQLGLLLWKNYVVRKRRPVIIGLVFLWPIAVFLLLYTVRDNVDSEYNPTCQYPSRLMPHDGILPFIQNYICTIGNMCDSLDEYEELPTIKNSTLGPIMMEMQSAMMNQTILTAVKTMPKSIQLLKSMAQILTKPEIKKLFDRGIRLGDLFNNHEAVKSLLKAHLPKVDEHFIDDLLNASIKLYYLIQTFGSSNLDGIICSPESLKKFLILDNEEDLVEISRVLCNVNPSKIPEILEQLTSHLDFTGVLRKVSLATAKFQEYDFIDDIMRAINTVLDLRTVKKYVPPELKLQEWLPKIVVLFKNVSLNEIDLSLISKMIDQLEPIFSNQRNWSIVRHGLVKLNSLLGMTNDLVVKIKSRGTTTSTFDLTKNVRDDVRNISIAPRDYYDVTRILDAVYVVLGDGVKLTISIIDEHADQLMIASEVMDGLIDFFPQYVTNVLTYIVSLSNNIVRITRHVAIIHEEINERIYNVSLNNLAIVKKILTTVEPESYRTLLQSLSRLDFIERLVDDLRKEKPEVLLCQEDILSKLFQGYKDFNGTSSIIRELLCSESGKVFVAEIYEIFEFNNFRKNVDDTLSTFVSMAFGQSVKIEKSNLTSLVTSVRDLMLYLENVSAKLPDWSVLESTEKWNKVYRDTRIQGIIDIFGIHLSIAKTSGSRSISYITIQPDLARMDMIAEMILRDLRDHPGNWIEQVREHVSELVESFYMTVADRRKILKILEFTNFSRSYCIDDDPPDIVNYPLRSNATLLRELVCRLASLVEKNLQFNTTEFEAKEKIINERGHFNWTAFNEKTLDIYRYIETLLQESNVHHDEKRLNQLKTKFVDSWTKDLTVRDGWEISVGIICKLFDVTESPLFNVRSHKMWERLYSLARAASVLADTVEHVIDQIQQGNHTTELSKVFRDLPQTEILLDVFLRNLESFTLDVIEVVNSESPMSYVSLIKNYTSVEMNWPCVENQSIGTILKLRNGSREVIREIERIACNPGPVAKEWKNHEVFSRVRSFFDEKNKDTSPIEIFNWTRGYQRFRVLVDKIYSLIDKSSNVTVVSLTGMRKIMDKSIADMEKGTKRIFENLDNAIDKNVDALKSDQSASGSWTLTGKIRSFDDILVLGKFATRVFHDIARFFLDNVGPDSRSINLIKLMGFTNKSVISLTYDKAPYIIAMIINGMSDPSLDIRADEMMNSDAGITCSDVFSLFYDYRIDLTVEEFLILKNSTCDGDPENFNAFIDLYQSWRIVWGQPVSQYHGYYLTLVSEIWELCDRSISMAINGMIVELPFREQYFELFLTTLTNALSPEGSTVVLNNYGNSSWWTYRLGIEGLSEILDHAVVAMNNVKTKEDVLHTWDLVESGDVRQLLKILESQAIEAIALSATLATYNSTSNSIVSFKDLRHLMCNDHFRSNYWRTKNRTHFLDRVCTFDAHQLLRRATSDEFYEAAVNDSPILRRVRPLSKTVTTFIHTLTDLRTSSGKKMQFVSNVFNATTWISLPKDTRELVRLAEKSWAHKIATGNHERNDGSAAYHPEPDNKLIGLMKLGEVVGFLLDALDGGDVWTRWKMSHENPKTKAIFSLIEDTPNFLVTFIDTFVNSERLMDFVKRFIDGSADGCDIEKYLIPPLYLRRKSYFSGIGNFCQNFIEDNTTISYVDLISEQFYIIKLDFVVRRHTKNDDFHKLNETKVFRQIEKIETTLVRLIKDGLKPVQVPSWWTSFEAGTWINFVKQYNGKDLKPLAHSIVGKMATVIKDITNYSFAGEKCNWCNSFIVQILNSQLSRHEIYSNLLCNINRFNYSRIREITDRDLYWNKTINMIKGYEYLNRGNDLELFVSSVKDAVQYVADIIIDYKRPANGKNLTECFMKAVGVSKNSGTKFYVKILLGIVDLFQRNVHFFDTSTTHEKLLHLTRMAESFVPIWRPLGDVAKKTEIQKVGKILPNATIDVNLLFSQNQHSPCMKRKDCTNDQVLETFLSSKRAKKLLRYDEKAAKYPSISTIASLLAESLDLEVIDGKIGKWRREASGNMSWLREILKHLTVVIEEGGNLLDIASKIDFNDVSKVLGVPDIADGFINLLKDKTIDKLFEGLEEIVDDAEPFIEDEEVKHDIRAILEAFESMAIFKNLGLFDLNSVISELFIDWNTLRRFLVEKIEISDDVATKLGKAKVDMLSVFMKERRAISLKDMVCSPKNLQDILSFEFGETRAEQVSSALCGLNDSEMQNITIELIKNINFEYIFANLMSANVKNILKNANLTEIEGQEVFDSIGVVGELVPLFKDKLSSGFSIEQSPKDAQGSTEMMSSGEFLQDASKMMCGKALLANSGQLDSVVGSIEDNKKSYDQGELDSLPTNFCRETYKNIVSTNSGKIVWSYVKPLLQGRILYAPNTTVVGRIMSFANETFRQIETFGDLINGVEKSLRSLASLTEMGQSLNDLNDIMASKVMKIAIKSMSGGSLEGDFTDFDIADIAWKLARSSRLTDTVGMLNDFLKCVPVNRFDGFASEEEMENEARILADKNEFLAGIVFLDQPNDKEKSKRSLNNELPNDVVYKIRMDIDAVPSTKRLKTQFWLPGPEAWFIEDLRYLRGFIQMQDAIDRAIIREKSGRMQNWKTVTQQMPYPCWKNTPFLRSLYESQGVQVCFFFALMMCVGSAVRYLVWEIESNNSMVMSVMGLKPRRNTIAWFITTYIELTIVMISICIILIAGNIMPNSDPILVMILLQDYVFSVVTFCYMVSAMFSTASLAAVTTVVMFLLTFMPYVIVIAMEASMGLCWKIFICLSMSTSFSYGCLYTVRREVQGTGINWDIMWENSSPGDSLSLGLVLIMIALDGIIYALIGYLVTRYNNSGQDFRGLRSHSLWWADNRSLYERPSYLAFVNSLYFTNDVLLQPSATYQDEDNDSSRIIVTEKQIGIRFESVRKVFPSKRGDFVAIDDFTLKLCEGEVTSLLGRNGAGKTTIIKILTGMMAPTSGEIYLNGEDGTKPDIGVCPQDNVLIDTLTPREHMTFYAKLKCPADNEAVVKNVNSMLASLELGKREHEPVYRLSGGTKRRLCVALAFLGSPKLVILDEPGAGVDPAARRRIWHLIDQHRANTTILLSTHHLDEADMLSDTVVVMHQGKILCTGSPLSLKSTYGHGYVLTVEFPIVNSRESVIERKSIENLRLMLENAVPNASVNGGSETELVMNLPFRGKNGESNDIAAAVKILEDNQKILGFENFSLECDTLNRIFLDLCARAEMGDSAPLSTSVDSVASVGSIGFTVPNDDEDLMIGQSRPNPKPLRQARALLKKRLWHFTTDWRSPLATLVLPTMFVAVAMGFSLIRPPSGDEPALDVNPKLYDSHPTYFYSIDDRNDPFLRHISLQLHNRFGGDYAGAWQTHPNDTGICECTEGRQVCHGVSKAVEGLYQTLPGRPTLDWIVSTFNEYIEHRYGGWSLSHANDDPLFIVWYNNKGHHAIPAYLNALNDAILRASGIPGHITTLNHPLRLSSEQLNRTSLLQHVADVGVALVLLIAFSLVAAQGARELVRERLSEEKRILFLAGVHPVTYWTIALIWDFLVFLASIVLAVMVFEIFGLSTYVARDNLAGVCLLLVLFAWAVIPFTHLVEKFFQDSSLSNMVLFCLNTWVGVACLATILVMDILGESQAVKDTRYYLHHGLLIFPQYALGDALVEITKNDITAELLGNFKMDTYKSPLTWELLGLHYTILFAVGFIFYAVNLIIECGLYPDCPTSRSTYEIVIEDEDVVRERIRVDNDGSGDVIKTIRLRKEYNSVYGKNVAVQNLSFGVEPGVCFGILGVNGAGKSTTFRMLTTGVRSTSGEIVLHGRKIGKKPLCSGEIGYCPQISSVDGFLTPHQCLTIHGEICGLDELPRVVESFLRRFDLVKYAHRRVSSLSGGNRRKLCVAISVMSPVSVVLMDEPTSGMDPASKEYVAAAVRLVTRSQGCVIMTSHNVAECENLCNRVGVLAKAGLRCIGTVPHLKRRFGDGNVAFLRFAMPISLKELKDSLARNLPTALISSRQAMAARIIIPRSKESTLSLIFLRVRQLAEELRAEDYSVMPSSLDQVLVNFSDVPEDDQLDGQTGKNSRAIPNTYTNISDAIHMETF